MGSVKQKFEAMEVYQIQIDSISSLYMYSGYRPDLMAHSFYDLKYGKNNKVFYFNDEMENDSSIKITHMPHLKQFYI